MHSLKMFLFTAIILLHQTLTAQAWVPVATMNGEVRDLAIHNNELVACGFFDQVDGNSMPMIASWDGNNWTGLQANIRIDSLNQPFGSAVFDHQGALFLGCGMTMTNDVYNRFYGASYQNGGSWAIAFWDTLNYFCLAAQHMAEYNSQLYVAGDFCTSSDTCGYATFVARWTGSGFLPLDNCPTNNNSATTLVNAMVEYNGKLYMAISDHRNGMQTNDILGSWNGTAFNVEYAVPNSSSQQINSLQVYNNDLYAMFESGVFGKWSGSAFDTSGYNDGLDFSSTNLYDHLLGVFGGELFADDGGHLVKWDGISWDNFNMGVSAADKMIAYEGSLYGTVGQGLARLNDSLFNENTRDLTLSGMVVYPNPAIQSVRLNWQMNEADEVRILVADIQGRILIEKKSVKGMPGMNRIHLDLENTPPGLYAIILETEHSVQSRMLEVSAK